MYQRPRSRLHSPSSALRRTIGTPSTVSRSRPVRVSGTPSSGARPPQRRSDATSRHASSDDHRSNRRPLANVGPRARPTGPSVPRRGRADERPTYRRRGFVQKRRFLALNLCFLLLAGLIIVPMVRLQVTQPKKFVDLARKQRIRSVSIRPERGDLVDRSGVPLAISEREWRIVADPKIIQKTKTVETSATQISTMLGVDAAFLRDHMSGDKRYVPLVAGIDEASMLKLQGLKLPGISLEETPRRIYPAGDVARSVLGRVGRVDHEGVSGLEKKYDETLRGTEGTVLAERARWGKQIPAGERAVVPAKRGTTYVLTIDSALNYATDGMLAQCIANTGAKGGTLVVADIASGDVLALSSMRVAANGDIRPSEDNQALVSVFEPGSTNKVITIAAALEEGVVEESTLIRVPDRLNVADHRFKDDEPHATETWTPGQILAESSNIGTIKIAQAVRPKTLDKYLRGFGLGQKTLIDFPGESRGLLMPVNKWTGTSIGTVPIGQGLAVTTMQMLSVYSTIGNGGVRIPLRLVRGTIDSNGKEHSAENGQSYRVVSNETAGLVTKMLERVVAKGTGLKAQIKGYTVAGKTGTAQKPNLHSRGYQKDAYVASFAGFFPSERPRLAIIAVLDEPKTSIYGGAVAAPLFAEAALFAGQHYRIPPSTGTQVRATADPTTDIAVHNAEMRAVAKAGSWQQATIRRAAIASENRADVTTSTIADQASSSSNDQSRTADQSDQTERTTQGAAVAGEASTTNGEPRSTSTVTTRRRRAVTGTGVTLPPAVTVVPPRTVPRPTAAPTVAPTTTAATIPDVSRRGPEQTSPPRAIAVRQKPVTTTPAPAAATPQSVRTPTSDTNSTERTATGSETVTAVE